MPLVKKNRYGKISISDKVMVSGIIYAIEQSGLSGDIWLATKRGKPLAEDKFLSNAEMRSAVSADYDENGRTFYGDEQMVFTDHKNNRRITTDKGNYNEASRVFTGERNVVFDAYKDSVRMTCDQGEYHERDSIFYGNGHVVVTDRKHDTRTPDLISQTYGQVIWFV